MDRTPLSSLPRHSRRCRRTSPSRRGNPSTPRTPTFSWKRFAVATTAVVALWCSATALSVTGEAAAAAEAKQDDGSSSNPAAAAAAASGSGSGSGGVPTVTTKVLQLGKDNFTTHVDDQELMLVQFFAPWCGHCKKLKPEFDRASITLDQHQIRLAKVDCTEEGDLCLKYKIGGYPTMKLFRQGEPSDYTGGREEKDIVKHMIRQALPPVSMLTVDQEPEFAKQGRVVMVGHVPSETSAEFTALEALAKRYRDDILFGAVVLDGKDAQKKKVADDELSGDAKLKQKAGSHGVPKLIMYRTFDSPHVTFAGDLTSIEALTAFLQREGTPIMDEVSPQNYMGYVESGKPLAFFFYDSDESKTKLGPLFEKTAKRHKADVQFLYCNATMFGGHAESLNLALTWPAFGIQKPMEGLKWPFDQSKELTQEAIDQFVDDFVAGKIPPSVKSAPEPSAEDQARTSVKLCVGSTFEPLALDPTKDVLVAFYAPWCGHSKRLFPTYELLAQKLANAKGIVIASMDATTNDVPPSGGAAIAGFPTIKLYKAHAPTSDDDTSHIVEYNGDRSVEDLIQFLRDNAVHNDFEELDVTPDPAKGTAPPSKKKPQPKDDEKHDEL